MSWIAMMILSTILAPQAKSELRVLVSHIQLHLFCIVEDISLINQVASSALLHHTEGGQLNVTNYN